MVNQYEWSTVYEANGHVGLVSIEAIILLIVLTVLTVALIKWWKKTEKLLRTVLAFIVIVLIIEYIGMVDDVVQLYSQDFYTRYLKGECLVTEGYITEYEAPNDGRPDSFCLNNIEFVVRDRPLNAYGYNIRQENGGVLKNGEYVRIHYFEYQGDHVMMKLDLRTSESP